MALSYYDLAKAVEGHLEGNLNVPVDLGARQSDPPVYVFTTMPGSWYFFYLEDDFTDANIQFQITSVGNSFEQTVYMEDVCRGQMLTLENSFIRRVRPHRAGEVRLDSSGSTPEWYSPARWWATVSFRE